MVAAPAYSEHDPGNMAAALDVRLDKVEEALSPIVSGFPARFTFSWFGSPVAAVLSPANRDRRLLSLDALLGALPFTAEDPQARLQALQAVSALARNARDRIAIAPGGGIHFVMETWVDADVSGSVLVEAMAVILIGAEDAVADLRPLLR